MAKFDFNKPVASFSWYLQNGSADDKRGNRLHVGTGQKAQIYFDPESGEFIGKLKYVDDYIALCLSKQNWFRNYVKVLKCYRWNADTQDFDIEDAIQDMMLRVL